MHERIDPTETQFPGSTSESQPISAPAPLLSSGLTSAAAQLPTTSPFSAPVPGLPNVFAAAEPDSLKTISLIIDGISLGLIPRSTWQPPKISTSHNWTDRQAAENLDGHPMTAFDQCRSTNRDQYRPNDRHHLAISDYYRTAFEHRSNDRSRSIDRHPFGISRLPRQRSNQPTSRPMPLSLMPPPPQFQFYEYEFVSERSTTSWVRQTHV
ncbi:hypothetical protein niasHT_019299 [Heterodera trifolii]|uniref:Uncharacterized protein n=1 Tax=Heterodera trifolii TaxID=157864 RepID=A0ABD2L5D2_9BILA